MFISVSARKANPGKSFISWSWIYAFWRNRRDHKVGGSLQWIHALDKADEDHDDGDDEEDMYEPTEHGKRDDPDEPQHDKDDSDGDEHGKRRLVLKQNPFVDVTRCIRIDGVGGGLLQEVVRWQVRCKQETESRFHCILVV